MVDKAALTVSYIQGVTTFALKLFIGAVYLILVVFVYIHQVAWILIQL